MKMGIILPAIASLALTVAIPASAHMGATIALKPLAAQSSASGALLKVATNWVMYCHGIRNRARRNKCLQEHNLPWSK